MFFNTWQVIWRALESRTYRSHVFHTINRNRCSFMRDRISGVWWHHERAICKIRLPDRFLSIELCYSYINPSRLPMRSVMKSLACKRDFTFLARTKIIQELFTANRSLEFTWSFQQRNEGNSAVFGCRLCAYSSHVSFHLLNRREIAAALSNN